MGGLSVGIRSINGSLTMEEHFFQCPYCWQTISMLLDSSVAEDRYVEDCEVCCHPIQIHYHFHDKSLTDFTAQSMDEEF